MDIFEAAIPTSGFVLQFLEACSAYSNEAKSLNIRFDWDMRVLQAILDHVVQWRTQKANQHLATEVVELLERAARYLASLVARLENICWKVQSKGRLHDSVNYIMWMARQASLKDLEKEIFKWIERFDVSVPCLPRELRDVIPAVNEFLALASNSNATRCADILPRGQGEPASIITQRGDFSIQPLRCDTEQIIFASRRVPSERSVRTAGFQDMLLDMGEVDRALDCLDPTADIRLLEVEYLKL